MNFVIKVKINTKAIRFTQCFDFWYNNCGICIKKFPDVEKAKNKNSEMKFYLVNVIENENEVEIAEKILKEANLRLENVYLYRDELSTFDVTFFPTVIMIDNNEIIFKGNIENLSYFNFFRNF